MPHIGNFPVIGFPKPLPIPPSAFVAAEDTFDWRFTATDLENRTQLTLSSFYAPVVLPQGVTVKKLTLYGFRDDALASMQLELLRNDRVGGHTTMAQIVADWITGHSSGYDDTITSPEIDNENYDYCLGLQLDPNDAVTDVCLTGALIEWG